MYEGLSHLNRNGFYIPQLRKDYFVGDSERQELEELVMLQESKQLLKKLKKAHKEKSGILTLKKPSDVTRELAKLLGEAKKLKRNTPVTLEEIEAKNLDELSARVAQVIEETLGGKREAVRVPPPSNKQSTTSSTR